MRILVLSPLIPFPPIGGGPIRTFHLLRLLAPSHELTLVGFTFGDEAEPAPFPVRTITVPWESPRRYREMLEGPADVAAAATEWLLESTPEPFLVSYFDSREMVETLRDVTRTESFDVILVETTQMARFLPYLPADTPKILDLWNVETLVADRIAATSDGEHSEVRRRDAEKMRRFERWAAQQCATCLVLSPDEALTLERLVDVRNVDVIPNGVDVEYFRPSGERDATGSIVYTGLMNYAPNVEAVQHFCSEILPLVHRRVPHAHFHVVGAKPAPEVQALSSERVTIHGFVPDVRPYLRDAEVFVVPLLHGGGIRNKILEAAASGRAVVSTTLGAEGLGLRAGEELLLADSPAEFADAVTSLLRDPLRREALERRARAAAERHRWERIGKALNDVVDRAVAPRAVR
jgi:sugar transferase (PEP-CTERM/EpsH1 system associated)